MVGEGFRSGAPASGGGIRQHSHATAHLSIEDVAWFLILAGLLLATWTFILSTPKNDTQATFFLTLGLLAIWRYGWWSVHQFRAYIFLKWRFPRLRRSVDALKGGLKVDHVYAVVMSYNIDPDEFVVVYKRLIQNALEYGVPTTIVASITSDGDRLLLNRLYDEMGAPDLVEVVTQFQKGDGKRSAMGMALRAISRRAPPKNSVTILMDGDVLLGRGAISRTVPFFALNSNLAAITTNNGAIVDGGYVTRQWYILRHAQRHALMASMSLSRRLLVLTGRFSLVRTSEATSLEFIERVESDSIDHWRYGNFRFVSGDDKSTWYHLIRQNGEMLYVPDVYAYGFESLPTEGRFFRSSTQLMTRWFGNMLRTNGRAIGLGPLKIGFFAWWSLIDQRISIWTSLVGPTAAILFSIVASPVYLLYYIGWVAVTRLVMSVAAAIAYGRFSFVWPFLMYYNQLWGAVLKTFLSFRLNRQGWTRQKIGGSRTAAIESFANASLHMAALTVLVVSVGLFTGIMSLPDRTVLYAIAGAGGYSTSSTAAANAVSVPMSLE